MLKQMWQVEIFTSNGSKINHRKGNLLAYRLAYRSELVAGARTRVCLANDEIKDGLSERGELVDKRNDAMVDANYGLCTAFN